MNLPVSRAHDAALAKLWREDEEAEPSEGGSDLRRPLAIGAGLLLVLFLLAALVPMGGAVIGMGQVVFASQAKRISHPTGGVIAQMLVRNGQHVKRGQVLIRLDDNVTGADASYSSDILEQLFAERARLEAEIAGAATISWPRELAESNTAEARKSMADALRLFNDRRGEGAQLRAQLTTRVSQYRQQISGLEAQIASLERQRTLIQEELKATRELWKKQLVTISRINQLERAAADLDGNIGAQRAQVAQTRAQISETMQQSIQLSETRRVQAGTQLSQVNTSINQQQLRSVAATDQQARSEIRAPEDGVVERLAYSSAGEVIKPGEPIMEVVPDGQDKVVEVKLSPQDIDQVRTGQNAEIRFTSFNMASTPLIKGKVSYISAERIENPSSREVYFVARIRISKADLDASGLELRSGMPAETHIETGSRSMLSYLFKPLSDQFARAFSDN